MCGIFGLLVGDAAGIDKKDVQKAVNRLLHLSEARGKEASGLAIIPSYSERDALVLKDNVTGSKFSKSKIYTEAFSQAFNDLPENQRGAAVIGHCRMVTNGSDEVYENNQPVVSGGAIVVHNGIIVNVDELWKAKPQLQRMAQVDSEILPALMRHYMREGRSPLWAVKKTFSEIRGTASVAISLPETNSVLLATNNGSLYFAQSPHLPKVYFASEAHILNKFLSETEKPENQFTVKQLAAQRGLNISLKPFTATEFSLLESIGVEVATAGDSQDVRASRSVSELRPTKSKPSTMPQPSDYHLPAEFKKHFQTRQEAIRRLRRCNRCVLPETVPFIHFDSEGICNHCRGYKKIKLRGAQALIADLEPFRGKSPSGDCIVALSGGRDSCYALHYIVKELGIRAVAYTYDWGMVTDIARRNISRMCSSLGVEHILVSADIRKKRENVRKNVHAWLKSPHLGMIPLFMAGDKQFFWYANVVKRQLGISMDVFSMNLFENTPFKDDFTGVHLWDPQSDSDKIGRDLTFINKFRILQYYGMSFLKNPAYLNSSLLDTFFAYISYYFVPKSYLSLYEYIPWDETQISETLINGYDWEVSKEASSTWRIGDGTTPFYNYIYYMVAGFSENETLRSNQIREGVLNRDKALELCYLDNHPRWESIQWYCRTIGIDFQKTIQTIHKMPTHFPVESSASRLPFIPPPQL